MAQGHFIRLGDKTTCGGQVLEADTRVMMFGIAHAREGDRVSCGKNDETYTIVGGVSYINSHGRIVAGSLDSFSTCPCRARLIPSVFTATYESRSSAAPQTTRAAAQPNTPLASNPAPRSAGFAPASSTPKPVPLGSAAAQEPGFYIVPKSTTREELEASLFTLRDPAVMGKFKLLNPNLRDVKAGSMIVLSDPNNYQCTREEALLMDVAAKTNQIIETLSPEEADFMVQHRDVIQTFLTYGSNATGIGASVFKNNLDNVGNALRDIEALQKNTLQRDGHLRSPAFFVERQRLLAQLNSHMTTLTRKGIGFPDHINLKKMLGISSQSMVHHWTNASPGGQIPGHASHLQGVAKASKYVKYGGWVGTAVGGGASAMKVQDVCTAGNTEACERVKFTEAGSFTGGVVGGAIAGAALSTSAVGGLCVGLGIPSGGVGLLVCSIVVVGVGSFSSSAIGGAVGEVMGERIFEATQ
ncbi:PAAR domain-containing protein [Pseudomonas sp. V98_8]|uniref:PAAR domain-containing protein n=1 Tax=Pseudomonas sp. V98_8 TaxID=3044228 RepID=UPI00249E73C3|nr:PAAR domain-containing protein [Pseudomonas sp. V98_8]MDI3391686.1 PAAR domain-containing protein [Pseudomonas sp. V98_8]